MSYFVLGDKRIYYEETGVGKTLLFLHGNTASSKMYAQIAEKYQKEYRVILIDFLGHENQIDWMNFRAICGFTKLSR